MNVLKYLTSESLITVANDMVQDKTDPNGKCINDSLREIFYITNVGPNWVDCANLEPKWIDFAKVLLKDERVSKRETGDCVIEAASRWGYIDIVELILQNNKVSKYCLINCVLSYATEGGQFDIVKLLLQNKRVNPSAMKNSAIKTASIKGHFDTVKLLLNDERINLSNYDFLPGSHDHKMNLVKILFENEQWLSKFDPEKLIIELLKDDNNNDIATFVVNKINLDNLTDKMVIDFANKCPYAPHKKILKIMHMAGITNVRIKIGPTDIKITEKNVIYLANNCDRVHNPYMEIIDIMKAANISCIRINIGPTDIKMKITEVMHKDGKDELVTTFINK